MTGTTDNAPLDPQQIIAELQRKLDEARAELAARNDAYSERIAYQAAANDVLKVMSASPGDPQPVFDLIVERARDLCGGYGSTVYQFDGTLIHWRAATGVSDDPSVRQAVQAMYPMRPTREWPAGRAIIDRQVIHIRDFESDPWLTPAMRGLTVKSSVMVPLMRGGLPIGVVSLGSRELGGFTDTQIELLKTFADQAVIAIENARLFDQVQQRTRELARSLDDLRTAQDRLVQTEKLASLGQLTAGIAHEIKNPLNFVNNFAALSVELADELGEALAPAPLDQKMRSEVGELTQMLKTNLEKGSSTANAPTRSSRVCCCIRARAPVSTDPPTSTPSSRTASVSPIMAHERRSRASRSRFGVTSTPRQERPNYTRRRLHGRCST
jgi:GAF domain-containing protein